MSNISGLTEAYASIYGQTSPQVLNEETVERVEETVIQDTIRELDDSEWEVLGALYDSLLESGNFSHEEALTICEKKKSEMEKGEKEEKDEKEEKGEKESDDESEDAGEDQEDKYPKKSGKKSKDYDGDGEVEDETDEYAGVKDKAIKKAMKKEEVELGEDAAYDRNRKRAAQRAQARNEARARGQTGSVPGVGYVSPRPERATYTDSAGVVRHHTGARMPNKEEVEYVDEDSRRMSNSQRTARVRQNIKAFGSNFTPPNNYDPDANRGQGEVLTHKQIEKKRRKGLRQEEVEYVDEKTAMAKRGHDETAIRNKIAKSTGGGEAADRASALEKKSTFGDAKKAKQRQDLAKAQRGDFRKTVSSNPGLHGYGHKSNDPKVKALQSARGAQRGVVTPKERKDLNMGYDPTEYSTDELQIINEVLPALAAAAGRALASGAVRSAVGNVAKNAAKEKVKQAGVNVVRNALGGNNSEDA